MKKTLKILVPVILLIVVISCIKYVYFPKSYKYGDWWRVAFWGHLKYEFCKYNVPEDYKYIEYREGRHKRLLAYTNTKTDQLFIVLKLREFPKIDFNNVFVTTTPTKRPFRCVEYHINNKFNLLYLLPFFRDDSLKNASNGLIIKGFKSNDNESFSTNATEIKYYKGEFTEIGFYKPSEGLIIKYPVPAIKFSVKNKGAIAVIKDKATGHTLISIGSIPFFGDFNDEEYKNILKSLTFDTEVKWEDKYKVRHKVELW